MLDTLYSNVLPLVGHQNVCYLAQSYPDNILVMLCTLTVPPAPTNLPAICEHLEAWEHPNASFPRSISKVLAGVIPYGVCPSCGPHVSL